MESDANRVDRACWHDTAKSKTGMIGVMPKQAVRFSRKLLYIGGQLLEGVTKTLVSS